MSSYPYGEFDAKKWAEEFVRLHGGDEELMLTWFASAIMTGHDSAEAKRRTLLEVRDAIANGPKGLVESGVLEWFGKGGRFEVEGED